MGKKRRSLSGKPGEDRSPRKSLPDSVTFARFPVVIHLMVLIVAGLIAYSNSFSGPFQFDDHIFVESSPLIKDISFFTNPAKAKESVSPIGYFWYRTRYVAHFTFAVNYALHGTDTFGYHLFNFLTHEANICLVYLLIRLLFMTPYLKATASRESSGVIAFFVALLFACHPLQTQAVTYIWQRVTCLSAFFYLLSLVFYLYWRLGHGDTLPVSSSDPNSRKRFKQTVLFMAAFIAALCAMKTKESAATIPLMLALCEMVLFKGKAIKRMVGLAPFFCLSFLVGAERLLFIDSATLTERIEKATRAIHAVPRTDYLFTQFRVILTYIRLLFFPVEQNLDYDYPLYHSFFIPEVAVPFLILLSLFVFGLYLLRFRKPENGLPLLVSFGIFWFFISLSVESSLLPIEDLIVEHRLYLPSVGIFIAAVSGIISIGGNRFKKAAMVVLSVVALVFIFLTHARNEVWRTESALWEDVIRKSPSKPRGYNNLGLAYRREGDLKGAQKMFDRAILLKPDYAKAYYNRGLVHFDAGRQSEALADFGKAISLQPDFLDAYNYRGVLLGKLGRTEEAIENFKEVIRLKPDHAPAYSNLGLAYGKTGRLEKALQMLTRSLTLDARDGVAYYNRGIVYRLLGKNEQANRDFRKACSLGCEEGCRQIP